MTKTDYKAKAAKDAMGKNDTPQGKHVKLDLPDISDAEIEREKSFFAPQPDGATVMFDLGGGGKHKKSKAAKVALIVVGVIVAILVVIYGAGCVFFSGHFFPNTTLGNNDMSLESTSDLSQLIKQSSDDYALDVSGYGFSMTLTSKDAGLNVDETATANRIMASQNVWAWPVECFAVHDLSEAVKAAVDSDKLHAYVKQEVDAHNSTATPTENARLEYYATTKQYEVTKESYGTQLDCDRVCDAITDALANGVTSLKLTQDQLIQPTIVSSDPRFTEAMESANTMLKVNVVFTLGDDEAVTLDATVVHPWVSINEDMEVAFDEEAVGAWIDEVADQCNTIGTERTYTRPDGKVCTVTGGDYGWAIKTDEFSDMVYTVIREGDVGTLAIPTTDTALAYHGKGLPDWDKHYIDVDLTEQHVYYYDEDGDLIWESDCVSGSTLTEGHATPQGVYQLTTKESPSKLVGYENGEKIYETEVQYWMPFEGIGVGFHDASWQSAFGGERYKQGYGSHGCINLPVDKAAELYEFIEFHVPIIVHE